MQVAAYIMEERYEPESPLGGEHGGAEGMEMEGAMIEPVLDEGRNEVYGRYIPEFQAMAPAWQEDAAAELIKVKNVDIPPNRSVQILRAAGRFWGLSTSSSRTKIFDRIRAAHVSALRLRALELAKGQFEAMQPHPRFQDAPAQPSVQEKKLHEVTHIPFKKLCSVCVQAKSRSNHQRATPPDELNVPIPQCSVISMWSLRHWLKLEMWYKNYNKKWG